ncbi:MAG: iron-containing alcohol dehydrogenase, partial [Methanomassiliicoccales archaeon]
MRKFVAPEIVFGAGALELAGQYAHNFSGRSVLLVSDSGVKEAGWASQVEDSLTSAGLRVEYFDRISSNPRAEEVMLGATVYQEKICDLIVAVGGGSPIDCAKMIGAVVANRCHALDLEGVDMVPIPGPPLICIPTTAGSSADVSQFAVINDEGKKRKFVIISKSMVPDVSLIDPLTTTTMTTELTAATGLDALSHAFEAYVSNASFPLTDMCALEAVRLISSNLPKVHEEPSNMQYREKVMLGSLYAGLAFSNASLGLVHAMAHSLGGFYDTSHGECNAILLEKVVEFNYPAAPIKYDTLEKAMCGKKGGPGAQSLVGELKDLRCRLGIPWGLQHMGVRAKDIPYL